jgi:hypothetical protein
MLIVVDVTFVADLLMSITKCIKNNRTLSFDWWNHSQVILFYDTFNHKMYLNAFPLFYLVLGRGRGWEKSEYKQQDRNV